MSEWLSRSPEGLAVPVQIQVPAWVTEEHFKSAAAILSKALRELKALGDDAYRGYIHRANLDGFPVKAGFAKGQKLEEIVIRALWWQFEQVINRKEPVRH